MNPGRRQANDSKAKCKWKFSGHSHLTTQKYVRKESFLFLIAQAGNNAVSSSAVL